METIKINEDEFRETIERAVREMENCGWEGWKCDVCYNPETGGFFISEPYSGERYYTHPDVFPLVTVKRWLLDEDEDQQEQVNVNVDKAFDDFLERKRDIEAVNNVILKVSPHVT